MTFKARMKPPSLAASLLTPIFLLLIRERVVVIDVEDFLFVHHGHSILVN